ncbi:MAG: carboxymuconolactone decarboxylase family protein [Caulobacteraceae bacterium]|nr:carboxymuconolactone decarboxylase family protein [Caulobacteraceae bacterium]
MSVVDWKRYRTEVGVGIGEMSRLSPETVQACSAMIQAGEKTGHLDAKTRGLIAIATAVQLRCDGCIAVYTEEARKAGATREEIAEALSVAVSVAARATLVYTTRAIDAYATATPA